MMTTLRISLAAVGAAALVASTVVRAQELPVHLRAAIGLEFLDPGKEMSREEAREKLAKLVFKNLTRLQGWPGDYASLKEHKALFIHYRSPTPNPFIPRWYRQDYLEPSVGYWGGGWEFESLAEAKAAATRACSRCTWCGTYTCIPFMEDQSLVIPDAVVEEYIQARRLYVASERKKFAGAEIVSLLERATRALVAEPNPGANRAVRLPFGDAGVGHPDHQQDYTKACQDRVLYPLVPVPQSQSSATLGALQAIENAGIYDEYKRTLNTVKNYTEPKEGKLWERMARYAIRIDINDDKRRFEDMKWPKYLLDALKSKRVQTVWLEGAVRITQDGLPLIPSDALAPLAVLADDALYLGNLVRLPDGEGECYVGKPFSGKVFDVSVCKDRLLCAKQALTSLQENLRKVFSAPPFESGPITGEDFAPGEFGLKRVREPSTLLGPPAYEISTYTFQTWSADADNPFGSLYGRQDFYGVQDKRDAMLPIAYLFLKVTHVLTTSIHRNGVYSEPEPNQVSKAEKLVSAAVQDSIAKTCANIGGKMLQSVCVVP